MGKTLNNVIHFKGSEFNWKNHIANGDWVDNIVFGLIIDTSTNRISKRYYSGRNSANEEFEYKNAISVNSASIANGLVMDDNLGLLITVINDENHRENGTYLVTYGPDNLPILQKIGDQSSTSAIHDIIGEDGISQNPNDEYVAVSVTVDSSNIATLNSSVQLAQPFVITDSSAPTGLATDGYVKDAIHEILDWVSI